MQTVDLSTVLVGLAQAEGPSRKIDEEIAIAAGYTNTGKTDAKGRALWAAPSETAAWPVPWFTNSIDTAKKLVDMISDNLPAAVTIFPTPATAQVEGYPVCTAATAPLALCAAAVTILDTKK